MSTTQTRRRFLTTLSLAGAANLLRAPPSPAAEGPLETTAIRFAKIANMCFAPQLVAEELLRAEGFTDIHYVDLVPAFIGPALASGTVDLSMAYTSQFAAAIDAVGPITLLAGVYDYALQTLKENAYDKWREYDPEDTLRFYALRLHEAGFIKSNPQKIIAENTDWRFLNELKRELKA